MTLWERAPEHGIEQERVSGPNYLDWRAQNSVFSEMAVSPGWDSSDFKLVLRDQTVKVPGMHASSSLFTMLGGAPLLGRTFSPEEDRREGNRVAVLGYDLWQRYFGGVPNVLGQSLNRIRERRLSFLSPFPLFAPCGCHGGFGNECRFS